MKKILIFISFLSVFGFSATTEYQYDLRVIYPNGSTNPADIDAIECPTGQGLKLTLLDDDYLYTNASKNYYHGVNVVVPNIYNLNGTSSLFRSAYYTESSTTFYLRQVVQQYSCESVSCSTNEYWQNSTATCQCHDGYYRASDGSCKYPAQCRVGTHFDISTESCLCDNTSTTTCPSTQTFQQDTCSCGCTPPLSLNTNNNLCQNPDCPISRIEKVPESYYSYIEGKPPVLNEGCHYYYYDCVDDLKFDHMESHPCEDNNNTTPSDNNNTTPSDNNNTTPSDNNNTTPDDNDHDGIPDSIDLDDDNDGIPDTEDTDGDGDGTPDSEEGSHGYCEDSAGNRVECPPEFNFDYQKPGELSDYNDDRVERTTNMVDGILGLFYGSNAGGEGIFEAYEKIIDQIGEIFNAFDEMLGSMISAFSDIKYKSDEVEEVNLPAGGGCDGMTFSVYGRTINLFENVQNYLSIIGTYVSPIVSVILQLYIIFLYAKYLHFGDK